MKTIEAARRATRGSAGIRFIAVSATIANVDDIAKWLGEDSVAYVADEERRPVPLAIHVEGYSFPEKTNPYAIENTLNYK